jgi:uncharacterized protein (DUF427 family)
MVQARWNGLTIADSEETIVVEGNHYFPTEAIDWSHLEASTDTTVCPWKGTARYFTITVNGALNPNAAWTYPDPSPEAQPIRDYVAFWHGVTSGNPRPELGRRGPPFTAELARSRPYVRESPEESLRKQSVQ